MPQTPPSPFPGTGALLLAAGKGTRMYSDTPKVLMRLLEEPMLGYVYRAVAPLGLHAVFTVVGHGAHLVEQDFPEQRANFVLQEKQLGTGHALVTAWDRLKKAGLTHVLVINADTPLVDPAALADLLQTAHNVNADLAFITLTLRDPASFGRVFRKDGSVQAIVEAKDYDPKKHGPITGEINAGVYCLRLSSVEALLPRLNLSNSSGEMYITDLVGLAYEAGLSVLGLNMGQDPNLLGVNSPAELVRSEEILRERLVRETLEQGVIIRNPSAVRLGPHVTMERGAEVTGPAEIYGRSRIEAGASIGSHCVIIDSAVGKGTQVRSFSHLEGAQTGPGCVIGPYARLRPGSVLEETARVGNFVEMKQTRLGKGAKANHLTYLGDADVGEGANIGAGTITCNYDGVNKFRTSVGKNAFIGSNTSLVAPVTVADRAMVGAGSVITRDVPEDELGVTRARQKNYKKRLLKGEE